MNPHPIQQFPAISAQAYSTLETQANSYDLAYLMERRGVWGDVVECGIAAGSNFAFMMLGTMAATIRPQQTFWGFDSFEGIQLAGPKDTEQAGIGPITHDVTVPVEELLVSSGITVHPMSQVIDNLTRWGLASQVHYKLVQGWVQHTLKEPPMERISILRLDMDIYEPTIFALRQLYDRISIGGAVIIDDWALDGVKIAVKEFWAERGISPEIHTIENSTPIYWFK